MSSPEKSVASGFRKRLKAASGEEKLARTLCLARSQKSPGRGGILMFILDSFCLPCKAFLHTGIGYESLTFFKVIFSPLFFFFCLLCLSFSFNLEGYVGPFSPGMVRVIPSIELPESWGIFWTNFRASWAIWLQSLNPWHFNVPSLPPLVSGQPTSPLILRFIAVYSVLINLRLVSRWVYDRFDKPIHPYSTGKSFQIFDPIHSTCYLFNIQIDFVKQFIEPAILVTISHVIFTYASSIQNTEPSSATAYQFLGIWMFFGAICLFIRAFIDNREIKKRYYDRIAAKMNAESAEAEMRMKDLYAEFDQDEDKDEEGLEITRR